MRTRPGRSLIADVAVLSLTAVALLGGCRTASTGEPRSGTLQKIGETNRITLGYREQSSPFSFRGKDGKPSGYSVELCERFVADLKQQMQKPNLEVAWVAVTAESRIPAVVRGTVDLECGSTTASLSRQEHVDFSIMTFVDGGTLLVRADSGIKQVTDVAGKRVAVIRATTTERAVRDGLQKAVPTMRMVVVADHPAGLAAVEGGLADAYASDRGILLGLAAGAPDPARYAITDGYFSYEPYGLMMRRGDAAFRLAVNRTLARIYRSEDLNAIYDRWFSALGPPGAILAVMYAIHALPE